MQRDVLIHRGPVAAVLAAAAVHGMFLAGCGDPGACADTTAADLLCTEQLASDDDWTSVSRASAMVDQLRTSKYMVPARADARLPTLFMNVNVFPTHWAFLREGFPAQFGTLSIGDYEQMILTPGDREFFAGSVTEYLRSDGSRVLGYVIWDGQVPESTITCDEAERVHLALTAAAPMSPVALVPATQLQRTTLAHCGVPLHDPARTVRYEAYQTGHAYGTIRRYTLAELALATSSAAFGWRDILILEEAPFDLENVISGVVTGSRQGELSHLNVRSAARGTPNCYMQDAYELFERFEGQLVRLECHRRELRVVPATPEQAQAWWDELRPEPVAVAQPDLAWTALVALGELPTDTAEDRARGLARFGAKGANLAALYQRIPPALQLDGFLVPMHYYDAFMHAGRWTVDLGRGPEELTFSRTIERLLEDTRFAMDAAHRRNLLNGLRAAMRRTPCDPELLAALGDHIRATYDSDTVMVRLRSSSNAEDSLRFSGAGLYSSTSACLADDMDGDERGPSHCDADKNKERGLCRGLTEVWASLWKPQAFEERAWYGIDHGAAAMGVLVNTRSDEEQANMVAFSGIPSSLLRGEMDDRYLVNAQIGDQDVVLPEPGVWPEKDLLTLDDAGTVTDIERVRTSSELPEGEYVLDDEQLAQLGAWLREIVRVFPVDGQVPEGRRVLLDTEWKVLEDGRLIIKQVRPFLD